MDGPIVSETVEVIEHINAKLEHGETGNQQPNLLYCFHRCPPLTKVPHQLLHVSLVCSDDIIGQCSIHDYASYPRHETLREVVLDLGLAELRVGILPGRVPPVDLYDPLQGAAYDKPRGQDCDEPFEDRVPLLGVSCQNRYDDHRDDVELLGDEVVPYE